MRNNLILAQRFQLDNPQWHVTITSHINYMDITICGFNENGKMYGYMRLSSFTENITTRLEYLVKHGYNPMKGVY